MKTKRSRQFRKYRRGGSKGAVEPSGYRYFSDLFKDRIPANAVFSKRRRRKEKSEAEKIKKWLDVKAKRTRRIKKLQDHTFEIGETVHVRDDVMRPWVVATVTNTNPLVTVRFPNMTTDFCFQYVKPIYKDSVLIQDCVNQQEVADEEDVKSPIDNSEDSSPSAEDYVIGQDVWFAEEEGLYLEKGRVKHIRGNEITIEKINPTLEWKLDEPSHDLRSGDVVKVDGGDPAIFVKYLPPDGKMVDAKKIVELIPYSVQHTDDESSPVHINP